MRFFSSRRSFSQAVLSLMVMFLVLASLLAACSDSPANTAIVNGTTNPNSTTLATNVTAPNSNPPLTANGSSTATFNPNATLPPVPVPTNELIVTPPSPTATPKIGGDITGAVIQDAPTLHYYKNTSKVGFDYLSLLFSASMTRRDPIKLTLEKGAADSWKVDQAAKTVTFNLRDGLKWSDGVPLTADDYVWTYLQAKKIENGWPYLNAALVTSNSPNADGIENVTATGPLTVVVKLRNYTFDIVSRADVIEPLPKHTWEKLDWNDPAKNAEINKPTVVSGPWLLKEWKVGEKITFVRNPNSTLYPAPNLNSLSFVVVSDSQLALQRLKSGAIDFYSPEAADQPAFDNLPNATIYKWTPGQTTWQFIGFNFRRPALRDKALRQALAYATDRKTILDKYGNGLGKPQYSDVPPWHPYYYDAVAKYDFNLDKAKELLKNAGYTGIGTKLADKSGKALPTLKIVYNTPSTLHEGIAQVLKSGLAALGLQVEFATFSYESYVKFLTDDKSDYDLFLSGWQSDYDPENFGEVWRNVPELNNGAYGDSTLIQLYTKVVAEPDAAKRQQLMYQVQKLEAEELPYIYLYAELGWANINKRIGGVSQTLRGVNYKLYTDWYLVQ